MTRVPPRLLALLTALTVALGLLLGAAPARAAAPAPVSGLGTVKRYSTGLRLAWAWRSGVRTYQVQLATNAGFRGARTVAVAAKRSRPSGGRQAVSVKGLRNATRFYVRVRALAASASPWSGTHLSATTVSKPSSIARVSARPGPGVGQATITWSHTGARTSYYRIETALTSFSPTKRSMPRSGRQARSFYARAAQRSLTLSAAQMAAAGAPVASGNHLYFRLFAINAGTAGTATRAYPRLRAVAPRGRPPRAQGTTLRAGSFNVRTAFARDSRPWPTRVGGVAATILSRDPGVVALQELNPGRADGRSGAAPGSRTRQTDSLLMALRARGGARYRLVRSTTYTAPGQESGSQGARLLYDSSRFRLVSSCPNTTGDRAWNRSCSIALPVLRGETRTRQRHAAAALLASRSTGQRFWAVSVHLDERHSGRPATEAAYDGLRRDQVHTVLRTLDRWNPRRYPVLFGGDLNSWQSNRGGHRSHDLLVRSGFYDGASAVRKVNVQYGTTQQFRPVVAPSAVGYGARLDVVMVKGAPGAGRYENVLKARDRARPSDHNLVVVDVRL